MTPLGLFCSIFMSVLGFGLSVAIVGVLWLLLWGWINKK